MAAVEQGKLAHERIEAPVRGGKIPKRVGEERRGSARPDEEREMGKVAPVDDELGDLVEGHGEISRLCARSPPPVAGEGQLA